MKAPSLSDEAASQQVGAGRYKIVLPKEEFRENTSPTDPQPARTHQLPGQLQLGRAKYQ